MKHFFIFIMLIFCSVSVLAQDDYYIRQANYYQREADYYTRQAQGYDREADYYNQQAQGYMREAEYYSRRENYDRVRSYQSNHIRRGLTMPEIGHGLIYVKQRMPYEKQKDEMHWLL